MRIVDLSPIRDVDIQYEEIVTTLDEKFKCKWDDAVHESYGRFISQLHDLSREVKAIRCKVEILEKEAEGLKTEELACKADVLCKEANAV